MHKNFTQSDPEGTFSWISPMTGTREYIIPPKSHEAAVSLFMDHPRCAEIEAAYWEGTRQPNEEVGLDRDRVRSGLQRVEDTMAMWDT